MSAGHCLVSARNPAPHGARDYPPRRTITEDVAEVLCEARLARGWSLREAARRVGVTHGTITHLGDDQNMRILNDGLRRLVGGGRRPRRPERLEPLIELMLRPLRGMATPAEISVARVILGNLRDMAEWNRPGWRPSTLDLVALRAAAGQELADDAASREDYEDAGLVGPFVLALALMSVFWLARHGRLRRQTRRGEGHDDREPQHLLREMMASSYGLDIFRQAIEDGRAGRAPRAIRPNGSIATNATGAEILISTDWLKEAQLPGGDQDLPGRPGR